MIAGDRDLAPIQRTLTALGIAAVLILVAGIAEYLHFEPPGQHTGAAASVRGVYLYDTSTKQVTGKSVTKVNADQAFAALIDVAAVPDGTQVDARWLDPLGNGVGSVGPEDVALLRANPIVPLTPPKGVSENLPGRYTIVVERWSGGRPVEVLDRSGVLVMRRP